MKDADPAIVEDLRARGLLFRDGDATSTRTRSAGDAARRCSTTRAPSWYVRTTAVKDRLLAVNDGVDWYPEHIQRRPLRQLAREQRRLGALARALLGHAAADLAVRRPATTPRSARSPSSAERAGRDVDRHRSAPAVRSTRSRSPAPTCGADRERVPEVIDAWYDSGAMPFAQWGYHPELGRGDRGVRRLRSPPTSSPRRSTRRAAGSTRSWPRASCTSTRRRTATSCASATSSPRTAGRCRSRSATSSTRGRRWTARAPTPCGGGC